MDTSVRADGFNDEGAMTPKNSEKNDDPTDSLLSGDRSEGSSSSSTTTSSEKKKKRGISASDRHALKRLWKETTSQDGR